MAAQPPRRPSAPSECPVCGADVPPRARACPSCGADERTGWNEDATRYDGLDLPESAFENEDASPAHQQSPAHPPRAALKPNGVPLFWWILAVLLLIALIASTLGLGF